MLKRNLKKLILCAVLLVSLLIADAPAVSAEVIFVGTNPAGSTVWVSFRSSAGYHAMRCPAGGGACTDVTPSQ